MTLNIKAAFDILNASEWDELLGLVGILTGFSQSGVGTCSAALTLTTTPTDITGCSVAVTVTGAHAYAVVTASAQFVVTAAAGVTLACSLLVDGVDQAALGTMRDSADQIHDHTRAFTWKVPLAAGAHTLKLRGSKAAALATAAISNTAGTNIVVMVFDVP